MATVTKRVKQLTILLTPAKGGINLFAPLEIHSIVRFYGLSHYDSDTHYSARNAALFLCRDSHLQSLLYRSFMHKKARHLAGHFSAMRKNRVLDLYTSLGQTCQSMF
ncbi:hypothetical protein [Microbulbifer sp. TYP-18]|uniref:hypothetical protein n=1 Tax=Microbulbifer sp. TYP-18 TaxID=3230024 RepID=UPI0034C6790F